MIVKKDSWHYKLAEGIWKETNIPEAGNNLCKYFWMVVWAGFVLLVPLALCLLLITVVVVAFYGDLYTSISTAILVIYFLSIFLLPIFAVNCFRDYFGENIEISTPTILSEYVKAKKNRICPMIDFE